MLRRQALAAAMLLGACLTGATSTPAFADGNLDCDDFPTSREAQAYYEANPIEASDLDRDRDGYACDWGTQVDQNQRNFYEGDSDSGGFPTPSLPWWAWVGGGIGLLWVIALIRVAR